MSVFVLFPKDEWQLADEKTRLDSDDYFYPQMSDRCYTDYSQIFKLQLTIYCVNMQNISNLFGGMKEKV